MIDRFGTRAFPIAMVLALIAGVQTAFADETPGDSTTVDEATVVAPADEGRSAANKDDGSGITYLVPELAGGSFRVSSGRREFKNRVSFSPGMGRLGSQDIFTFRLGYNPNSWLGYEIAFEHNPASSVHALLHTFNVTLRYPLSWRMQPYATIGYGMMTVFPGQAVNADPVTKNALTGGGGLELYMRDDVAIRTELRGATVLGQELGTEGTVAYSYREYTIGFTFYRSLGR